MSQPITIPRAVLLAASAALASGGCNSEPDSARVETIRNVDAPGAERRVRRTVTPGTLASAGDGPATGNSPAFPACAPDDASATYPGEHWQAAYAPGDGWSEEGLERAWKRARAGNYAAGMLVHKGRVIGHFGEVDRPYEAASIRKSMLNAIAGQLVREGRLKPDSTLAELGIDENPPLNATERSATVEDLLMSRSGIYRPAAYSLPSQDERPEPGQFKPGEHFYYNNWDFNALGTIIERAGGASVFELFRDRLAAPTGMQDYSLDDTRYVRDEKSVHPAYVVRLSTRDRARLGHLYLRNGCWAGQQVVPADWVQKSTSALTNREDELDYGYLWWSQEGIESQGLTGRVFMARGNPLQYVMVFPEIDAVLVLTADRNYPGWINWFRSRIGLAPEFEDYSETLRMVLQSRPRSAAATQNSH